jgi:hypothetical protein
MYEGRYDERLKTKSEKSTHLGYTGLLLLQPELIRMAYGEATYTFPVAGTKIEPIA